MLGDVGQPVLRIRGAHLVGLGGDRFGDQRADCLRFDGAPFVGGHSSSSFRRISSSSEVRR